MTGWRREAGRGGKHAGVDAAATSPPVLQPPLGQGQACALWLRAARAGTLPHGLLIEGPRGSGKSTLLAWFAAALLCPAGDADGPCGQCAACRRVATRAHPDLIVLDRAQDAEDKRTWGRLKSFYVITVDQVRMAIEVLQRHAVEGRARVLMIEDADCLHESAQNALLKTLEEPGRRTFLLLETASPDLLLPTVRSRVQRLRTARLPAALIERELARRQPAGRERFAAAIAEADGALGPALEACTERAVQIHDLVSALLAAPERLRPWTTAQQALAGATERWDRIEAARTFLRALRTRLRQSLHALASAGSDAYPASSAEPWTTWLESTVAAEQDLELQIPPEQALVACLLAFTVA